MESEGYIKKKSKFIQQVGSQRQYCGTKWSAEGIKFSQDVWGRSARQYLWLTIKMCGRNLKKGGRNLPKRTNLDALHIVVPRCLVSMITSKLPPVTIKRDLYQPTVFFFGWGRAL